MEKEIVNQVQETQRLPYINQTNKTKHKERILKAAREKQQVTYKGNPIHLTAVLSAETAEGNGRIYLKY